MDELSTKRQLHELIREEFRRKHGEAPSTPLDPVSGSLISELRDSGLFQRVEPVPSDGAPGAGYDLLLTASVSEVPDFVGFHQLLAPFLCYTIIGCFIYYSKSGTISAQISVSDAVGKPLKSYSETATVVANAEFGIWGNSSTIPEAATKVAVKLLADKFVADFIKDRPFYKELSRKNAAQAAPVAGQQGLDPEQVAKLAAAVVDAKLQEPAKPTYHSSVDEPDYHVGPRPDDFAVVVGVENYAQNLPRAQFAKRDAKAFERHLIALGVPPRHIAYLEDERASRSALVMQLDRWLPNNVKADSRVFFYFSGHGAPDPESGNAYLVPFDGNPGDLEDTAYSLRDLYTKLAALKARRVIVALDSCFSGAGGRSVLAKGTRPLVIKVREGVVPDDGKMVVLTASRSDQITGVLEEQGHGAFTYYLLNGLNGKALDSDKRVTARSLYAYLKPKVEDAARLDNRNQTPQMLPSSAQSGSERVTLR